MVQMYASPVGLFTDMVSRGHRDTDTNLTPFWDHPRVEKGHAGTPSSPWRPSSPRSTISAACIQRLSQPRPQTPRNDPPTGRPRTSSFSLPPLPYGRPGRTELSDPARLGELTVPRSTEPSRLDMPVALTSPRLSPRYRIPHYLPLTSCSDSPPRSLSGLSPRAPLALNRTTTPAVKAAEPYGKHLLEATGKGDIEHMRSLIANQLAPPADFQFRNSFGNTALMIACQRSHYLAARLLVVSGAPLDAADKFGSGALHYACRAGSLPTVRLLMAAGADLHTMNKHGRTPRDFARGHADVIAFLETLAKAEDAKASLEREDAMRVMAAASFAQNSRTEEETVMLAAIRLQAALRGKLARVELTARASSNMARAAALAAEDDARAAAAATLQAQRVTGPEGNWTRFDAAAGDDATLQIADWHATRLAEGQGLSKEAAEANVPHAATRVQAHVRGRKARSKMKIEFEAERKAELAQRASRGSPRKKDFDYYLKRGS